MSMLITSVVSDSLRPYELARQALLSLGFSGHESWGGLPCPPPGDLPDPGMGPASLMSCTGRRFSLPLVPPGKPTWLFAM